MKRHVASLVLLAIFGVVLCSSSFAKGQATHPQKHGYACSSSSSEKK